MPVTPFHALALLFVYFKSKKNVDLLALTASTTFIDLEPLYYTLIGEPLDHQIWHSFLMVITLYPVLIAVLVYVFERVFEGKLWRLYSFSRFEPVRVVYPFRSVFFLTLVGGLSHIFFDVFTHEKMPYASYPLIYGNPIFLGTFSLIAEGVVILMVMYSGLKWLNQGVLKRQPT